MLHDAARKGDVEIPVFCYEPKLGEPVGACRMCLVEIEGIPKLQTSCSTPVRDGMVVHTRTEQVKHAQSAVVEFLLVNHPLDCPVCDKGGECPLQDITQGWGPGKSRVIDEKRHFEKPIELSPLVAIDRERCILCYRCVRFSQEVSEDAQLQLLERGDRTFVGTFDDRPYVAPFHGNITELCPVGALTNYTYRFRARPWDIEQAGSVCTLCPSQCNVSFTVRDEKVKRVLGRDNAEVDDGWLCDRGRYGFEMFAAEKRVDGPRLKGGAEATGRRRSRRRPGPARAGGQGRGDRRRRLQRGGLPGPAAGARGARLPPRRLPPLARPRPRGDVRLAQPDALGPGARHRRRRRDPRRSAPTRCTARRSSTCGSARRSAATAPSWPSPPSGRPRSTAAPRRSPATPPARRAHFLAELAAPPAAPRTSPRRWPRACATPARSSSSGASASPATRWRPRLCSSSPPRSTSPAARAPACSKSPTPPTPAACARPAASPTPARACAETDRQGNGRRTEEIRAALESGELTGLILFGVDPLRDFPDTAAWEAALTAADFVVSFSMFENATTAKADVLFPLETHAEKDGTVTHPDGRLQRVRPSAGRPGEILPNIQVLAELSAALGHDTGIDSQPTAFAALTQAVPFYADITDADIGGRGIRWQDTQAAANAPGRAAVPPRSTRYLAAERRKLTPRGRVRRSSSRKTSGGGTDARSRDLPRSVGGTDYGAEPATEVPDAAAAP